MKMIRKILCWFGNHKWFNGLNDPKSLYTYCGGCGLKRSKTLGELGLK